MTGASLAEPDSTGEARRRIADEIAARLRRTGVQLTGKESSEELVEIEEAVEHFERSVERAGGDLMVDEPVSGGSPIAPDQPDFVLPARKDSEQVTAYIQTHSRRGNAGRTEGKRVLARSSLTLRATTSLHQDRSRHCGAVHLAVVRVGAGGRERSRESARRLNR